MNTTSENEKTREDSQNILQIHIQDIQQILRGRVAVRSVGGMRLAKARRLLKFRNGITIKDVDESGGKAAIHWTDPACNLLSK